MQYGILHLDRETVQIWVEMKGIMNRCKRKTKVRSKSKNAVESWENVGKGENTGQSLSR